jgi:hypothetical protein
MRKNCDYRKPPSIRGRRLLGPQVFAKLPCGPFTWSAVDRNPRSGGDRSAGSLLIVTLTLRAYAEIWEYQDQKNRARSSKLPGVLRTRQALICISTDGKYPLDIEILGLIVTIHSLHRPP